MHANQIERYGESQGAPDHGLLESALYRPETVTAPNSSRKRRALGEPGPEPSFHRRQQANGFRHQFTFLAINGAELTANAEDAYAFVSGLYEEGVFSFDKLVQWLRSSVSLGS